jgi:hypothetical protein
MIYGTFVEAFGELSKEITFLSRTVCKDDEHLFMTKIRNLKNNLLLI